MFTLVLRLLIAASVVGYGVARAAEVDVESRIERVTVYGGQAEVIRQATVSIDAGTHEMVFTKLPSNLYTKSLRAKVFGPPGVTLIGLKHEIERHVTAPRDSVAVLGRQLEELRAENALITDRLTALQKQRELIEQLIYVGGEKMRGQIEEADLAIQHWTDAFSFVGETIIALDDSARVLEQRRVKNDKLKEKLEYEISRIRSANDRQTVTVHVTLGAIEGGEVSVQLSYVIAGANWTPLYDARLNSGRPVVSLDYFGEVVQTTGEDWIDVRLRLSTAQPSRGTGPGEFRAQYLFQAEPVFVRGGRAEEAYIVSGVPGIDVVGHRDIIDKFEVSSQVAIPPQPAPIRAAKVDLGGFDASFEVLQRETLVSGGRTIRTPIVQLAFDADITYLCRPSNHQGVFRVAKLVNRSEQPLMPGTFSIFDGSTYLGRVGMTELILPGQEFELPFGLANEINVTRERLEYKRNPDDDKMKIEQTIRITLANHGQEPRRIRVEEPIPITQDDRVKVKVDEIKPKPDDITLQGRAIWTLVLAPAAEQVVTIPYKVEYPLGLKVYGL